MWKSVTVLVACFLILLVILVILQPAPQGAALANLSAVEKLLDQAKTSETPAKFEEARKALVRVSDKASTEGQGTIAQALVAVDDLESTVEGERAKLNAIHSQIRSQVDEAKDSLVAFSSRDRATGVKDQLLALLWPVVLVLLVLYLLHSKISIDFFTRLASIISNVKIPGGLEIAFASTAVKSTQEEVLSGYRQQVISKYDGVAKQYQIAETVSRIVKGPIEDFFRKFEQPLKKPRFRCTVHVRDILFDNSLYQLIDYIGSKGGRGRAWSVRRGMIGRCWRSEKSDRKGSVPKDEAQLIDNWGLTKDELEGANKNQTMLCHLIKADNQSPLALLYLDCEDRDAFGDEKKMDDLDGVINKAVKDFGLDRALEQVWQQARASAPLIEIYADHFAR